MPVTALAEDFLKIIPFTMRSIRKEVGALAGPSQLSLTQFRALAHLSRESATNGKLAQEIGVSVPATTRVIDALVKQGLVHRRYSQQDRREVSLELTERGSEEFKKIWNRAAEHYAKQFLELSDEDSEALKRGLMVLRRIHFKEGNT